MISIGPFPSIAMPSSIRGPFRKKTKSHKKLSDETTCRDADNGDVFSGTLTPKKFSLQ